LEKGAGIILLVRAGAKICTVVMIRLNEPMNRSYVLEQKLELESVTGAKEQWARYWKLGAKNKVLEPQQDIGLILKLKNAKVGS